MVRIGSSQVHVRVRVRSQQKGARGERRNPVGLRKEAPGEMHPLRPREVQRRTLRDGNILGAHGSVHICLAQRASASF